MPEKAESIETIIKKLGKVNDLENRLEAFKDMKEKAVNAMPEIENNINNLELIRFLRTTSSNIFLV